MSKSERDSAIATGRADALSSESEAERERRVAVAAYYRAEQRSFEPGKELDDWLEAERELIERS